MNCRLAVTAGPEKLSYTGYLTFVLCLFIYFWLSIWERLHKSVGCYIYSLFLLQIMANELVFNVQT